MACIASYSVDDTENTSGSVTRKATVMSASLLTMQPCSTAMTGNLLSSVDVVNVLLIIYDCCFLIRRVIRFREMIRRGCCRAARSFISPWLPNCLFSEKVSQTIAVAADTPKPIHTHCPMPAVYMMTNPPGHWTAVQQRNCSLPSQKSIRL